MLGLIADLQETGIKLDLGTPSATRSRSFQDGECARWQSCHRHDHVIALRWDDRPRWEDISKCDTELPHATRDRDRESIQSFKILELAQSSPNPHGKYHHRANVDPVPEDETTNWAAPNKSWKLSIGCRRIASTPSETSDDPQQLAVPSAAACRRCASM